MRFDIEQSSASPVEAPRFGLKQRTRLLKIDETGLQIRSFGRLYRLEGPGLASWGAAFFDGLKSPCTMEELNRSLGEVPIGNVDAVLQRCLELGLVYELQPGFRAWGLLQSPIFAQFQMQSKSRDGGSAALDRIASTSVRIRDFAGAPASVVDSVRAVGFASVEHLTLLLDSSSASASVGVSAKGDDLVDCVVFWKSQLPFLERFNDSALASRRTWMPICLDEFGCTVGPLLGCRGGPCLSCVQYPQSEYGVPEYGERLGAIGSILAEELIRLASSQPVSQALDSFVQYDLQNYRSARVPARWRLYCEACSDAAQSPNQFLRTR